jgi:ribosomal protein L12E/L44/L45/RPP1/RPP2
VNYRERLDRRALSVPAAHASRAGEPIGEKKASAVQKKKPEEKAEEKSELEKLLRRL